MINHIVMRPSGEIVNLELAGMSVPRAEMLSERGDKKLPRD